MVVFYMRLTYHNGRSNKSGGVYSAKHNDRNFNIENVDHIDSDKQNQNEFWHCYNKTDPNLTFEQAEKKFYEDHFGKFLAERNEKYLKQRHKDKVQTVDDYLKSRKSCPEEIIFAVGNVKDFKNIDTKKITRVYNEFMHWRRDKYPNVVCIDVALHADEEGVPHIQERVAWIAHDKNGNEMVNQGQALREMGVEIFDPQKKESRYNNAKITFTRDCRQKFFEICRGYGIEIEEKPKERSEVGLSLTEYKTRQEEQKLQEIKSELEKLKSENKILKTKNEKLIKDVRMMEIMKNDFKEWLNKASDELPKKEERLKFVKAEIDKGEKDLREVQKIIKKRDVLNQECESAKNIYNELENKIVGFVKPIINLKEAEKNNDLDARESAINEISQSLNKILPKMDMYNDIYQDNYEKGYQKFSKANPNVHEGEKGLAFMKEVVRVHGTRTDKIVGAVNAIASVNRDNSPRNINHLLSGTMVSVPYKQSQNIGGQGILSKIIDKIAGKGDKWASLVIPPSRENDLDDWNMLSETEKADRRASQPIDRY